MSGTHCLLAVNSPSYGLLLNMNLDIGYLIFKLCMCLTRKYKYCVFFKAILRPMQNQIMIGNLIKRVMKEKMKSAVKQLELGEEIPWIL